MGGVAAISDKIPTQPHLGYELELHNSGLTTVAGLDEAGRGALAGPVVAAALILPLDDPHLIDRLAMVRDSKELSASQREQALGVIERLALVWGCGVASHLEVDELGLLPATRLAMTRALAALSIAPHYLLIDHLILREDERPQTALVHGDRISLSIAAASIIAKVTRDRQMVALGAEYPGYGLAQHKGYGTMAHRQALARLGPSPIHRLSYQPVAAAMG